MSIEAVIRSRIRTVPNWPEPGVMFRDITPLLSDAKTFRILIDAFVEQFLDQHIDIVAGIDARGVILGSVVAYVWTPSRNCSESAGVNVHFLGSPFSSDQRL